MLSNISLWLWSLHEYNVPFRYAEDTGSEIQWLLSTVANAFQDWTKNFWSFMHHWISTTYMYPGGPLNSLLQKLLDPFSWKLMFSKLFGLLCHSFDNLVVLKYLFLIMLFTCCIFTKVGMKVINLNHILEVGVA